MPAGDSLALARLLAKQAQIEQPSPILLARPSSSTMTTGGRMKAYGRWIQRVQALALGLVFAGAALANADVEKLTADPKNWAMQAGDMYNQRYSKLTQINTQNVGKMQVAWMFSTGVLRGHEGSPLVVGNTMYLHT